MRVARILGVEAGDGGVESLGIRQHSIIGLAQQSYPRLPLLRMILIMRRSTRKDRTDGQTLAACRQAE